jgi:predicted enzyme related to lactoylglutathione lyase
MAIKSPLESQQAASPETPFYRRVPDLERAIERTRALGGRVLLPPSKADRGRIAVVTDPEGRPQGLMQSPEES